MTRVRALRSHESFRGINTSELSYRGNFHILRIWVEHMEMHTRFLYLNREVKTIDQQLQAVKAQGVAREQALTEAKAAATKSAEEAAQYRADLLKAQEKAEAFEQETASARAKEQEDLRLTREQLLQRGKELSRALEESATRKRRAEDLAAEKKAVEDEFAAYKEKEPERVKAAQEAWLSSREYFDQYQEKTAKMLEYGFDGALNQVYEAGLFPEGTSLDFLDIEKVWAALPEEDRRGH
ncbi:uncharacterized protein LOC141835678 [Curcuma longa]|uniref:uncharacterized protein LOC141835678 n=1 Tax=Curcuma longa TaxID=136217 RepID=UPI003D9E528B